MQKPEKAVFFLEKADDIFKLWLKEIIKMQIIKKPEIAAEMEVEVVGVKIYISQEWSRSFSLNLGAELSRCWVHF